MSPGRCPKLSPNRAASQTTAPITTSPRPIRTIHLPSVPASGILASTLPLIPPGCSLDQASLFRTMIRQSQVFVTVLGHHAPARGAVQDPLLQEVGLHYVHDRIRLFADGGRDGFQAHGAA